MSKKLCLKWNDFQDNTNTAFASLRNDKDFSDIILSCEDGQQVEAHRVILASSSPFFLNLLRRNKHPHPLIYMRGLKSEDLVAIVDFLYYGEANVYHENLDSFLSVAEELKLKGLNGNNEPEVDKAALSLPDTKPFDKKDSRKGEEAHLTKTDPKQEISLERMAAMADYNVPADVEDWQEQIKSMMEVGETISYGKENRTSRICKICGKQGKETDIKRHIDSNHLTGVSHTCNNCGKSSSSRDGLRRHMLNYHK